VVEVPKYPADEFAVIRGCSKKSALFRGLFWVLVAPHENIFLA
jgi:hypothetical protein